MGSYPYLATALFGLLFVTSSYQTIASRITKGTTSSDSSTLSPSPALSSSHTSSSSSPLLSPSSSLFLSSKSSSAPLTSSNPKDFVSIQTNRYGERDIRVVLGNVRLHVLSVPSDKRHQLELRRTADRRHYVKSVYKKGFLRDCEFTDNATEIADFRAEFNLKSYEESTIVYPIHRHGQSNKKKGKRSRPGEWKLGTDRNRYQHHKNKKNGNHNKGISQNNISKGRSIVLDKHRISHRGRYRKNAGYILQIAYDHNASHSNSMELKPLPYAVLFKTDDIGIIKSDRKAVYLNVRINPRAETRVCRQLYRRVKRMSRYNRSNLDRDDKPISYRIGSKNDNHGLPEIMDSRDSGTKQQTTKQISSTNGNKEGTDHNPPLIHPLRHQHNRHHKSTNSRTPGLKVLSRTVLPVVGGHAKEHQSGNGSNPGVRRRSRRQLNGMLIYPGTKWCGNGNTAEAFDDLGSETEADICCREHDYCPFTIESFTRRFNLFNYRLHTLSHCECDFQFRKCLSKEPEESTVAHLVGRIYFDFLGSRCFVFTKEKYCVERSWWGKCRRYGIQLTAKIKVQEGY